MMNLFSRNGIKLLMMSFCVALTALSMSSCGSSRHTASHKTKPSGRYESTTHRTKPSGGKTTQKAPRHIDMSVAGDNPVTAKLLSEADQWIGTPYLWGGNDNKGVDCSGFVLQVYLRSLEISLPRNSEKQMLYCNRIAKEEMVPGDLVFFTVRGGDRVGHVGMYIGGNNMVHASSSKGVIITSLDNPYFVRNYYSSGRVERYHSMVSDKKKSGKKKPDVMLASKNSKPSASPKAAEKKPAKKAVPKRAENKPDTPMPSEVFASKPAAPATVEPAAPVSADPSDEPEESPDFFD